MKHIKDIGFPVIIKAAYGGGGRGMRVVRKAEDFAAAFQLATSEALTAFGNGTCFLERYLEEPRHVEVQILGDGQGNVIHLRERDCSVQRRHQKVIEMAPALALDEKIRDAVLRDALKLVSSANYRSAGTVEFLVDKQGRHYFMEVNPRIQVEHTVTEEVTGIDIVQAQMRIAQGFSLKEIGLTQDKVVCNGCAIQARITTENPAKSFQPDTGKIRVYREASGQGIRLDGIGHTGQVITPYYDSLLMKITARGADFPTTVNKLIRAVEEYRVRGLKTNQPFILNVLSHPTFQAGKATTFFIDEEPNLMKPRYIRNRAQKTVQYLANLIVNGHPKELGCTGPEPAVTEPCAPAVPEGKTPPPGFKQILTKEGPEGLAKAVLNTKRTLLTDTTWRDAHQSLLATRMRTRDILAIAPFTACTLPQLFSLECWGGATFDVCMRFLRECPWERLERMRELVPNIPFQMLLRGANAVGYTAYSDNVVHEFCKQSVKSGMDVFRVFDSLNYLENMKLGIDAVGQAGGVVEASICYSGDCASPHEAKYTVDYYLDFARKLSKLGVHILNIKDMAGLLKPEAATILVSSLRKEFPNLPIHIHTHDTAGTGVASMIACAKAGANIVDVATDAMSGMTSQPSMGAVIAGLQSTPLDTGISLNDVAKVNDYWSDVRGVYSPWESGQKSGSSDVYLHEMPGGQYTNLLFQSQQLGLTGQWPAVKTAYAEANKLLGNVIKVTPSSKVVGDLAQFLVANKMGAKEFTEKAETLSLPQSVIQFFQGYLGIPEPWGFPEELRQKICKGKKLPNGQEYFKGRPGADIPAFDFAGEKKKLVEKYGEERIKDYDVISHALYPQVFADWKKYEDSYGDVTNIPTRYFLRAMKVNEEIAVELEKGKIIYITYLGDNGTLNKKGERELRFNVNGQERTVAIVDKKAGATMKIKEKAKEGDAGSIGAPMPGVCVAVAVKSGDKVKKGDKLVVLNAMKMETVVASPIDGTIKRLLVNEGDDMEAGDLILEITP